MLVKIQLIFSNWESSETTTPSSAASALNMAKTGQAHSAAASQIEQCFCNFVRFLMEEKSFGREVNALLNHPALNKHIHLT